MSELAISTVNLCRKLGEFRLENVSIELPRGFIMGFIGPNGAGKSTTIKLLMNLLRPDSGHISLLGMGYKDNSNHIKHRVGYVGEEQWFYEDMTVAWTGKFVSRYYSNWDNSLFIQHLKQFNIDPAKRVKQLSKGMRVKLSLALALAHQPELLIMDEPTSGLDPLVRKELLQELLDVIQDENRSVFFSSHITEDIQKVADYVTYISNGHIILTGEKEKILEQYRAIRYPLAGAGESISSHLMDYHTDGFNGIGVSRDFAELRRLFPSIKFDVSALSLDDILSTLVKEAM